MKALKISFFLKMELLMRRQNLLKCMRKLMEMFLQVVKDHANIHGILIQKHTHLVMEKDLNLIRRQKLSIVRGSKKHFLKLLLLKKWLKM